MTWRPLSAFVTLCLILTQFSVGPTSAEDPCTNNGGVVQHTVIAVGPNGGKAYVEIRELLGDEFLFSVWVYIETNGLAGLQRGSADVVSAKFEDPCQDPLPPGYEPDQHLFRYRWVCVRDGQVHSPCEGEPLYGDLIQ